MNTLLKKLFVGLLLVQTIYLTSCETVTPPSSTPPQVEFNITDFDAENGSFNLNISLLNEADQDLDAFELAYSIVERIDGEDNSVSAEKILHEGVEVDIDAMPIEVRNLDAGKSFTVYVAARNFDTFSNIASEEISTDPAKFTYEASIVDVTTIDATINVTTNNQSQTYLIRPISFADYNVTTRGNPDLIHDLFLEQIQEENEGLSLQEALAKVLRKGNGDVLLKNLPLSTLGIPKNNYVMVYAMNNDGVRLSGMTMTDTVRTVVKESEASKRYTINFDATDTYNVEVSVQPSSGNSTEYVYFFGAASDFDGTSANARANEFIEKNAEELNYGDYPRLSGSHTESYEIIPGKQYFALAFGYDKGILTAIGHKSFTGGTLTDPDNLKFEATFVESDITETKVVYDVTPSNDITYWSGVLVPSSGFISTLADEGDARDEEQDNENAIIDSFEARLVEILAEKQLYDEDYTMAEVIDEYCMISTRTIRETHLAPGTDYTLLLWAVEPTGKAVSNVDIRKNFLRTQAAPTVSDAKFTTEIYGIFDGDDAVAEGITIPSYSGDLSGKAIIVAEPTLEGNPSLGYHGIAFGDFSDSPADVLETYARSSIFAMMMPKYLVYVVEYWYNDFTIISRALGDEGYGAFYTNVINPNKIEAGNIDNLSSILEDLPAFAPKNEVKDLDLDFILQ